MLEKLKIFEIYSLMLDNSVIENDLIKYILYGIVKIFEFTNNGNNREVIEIIKSQIECNNII